MRRFKKFTRVNKFMIDAANYKEFAGEIKRRFEGMVVETGGQFLSARNPLHPMSAISSTYYRYNAAFHYLDKVDYSTVLEIGCGHGLPAWLLSETAEVTAIDIDPQTIETGARLFPEVKFECSSIAQFFENNSDCHYDLIISAFVPTTDEEIEIIKAHCNRYVRIGHLPSTWHEILFRKKCRYISYDTVAIGEGLRGLEPDYFRYHFHIDYLNGLKRIRKKAKMTWR
jgi:SAM-dependent methyltransferase